MTGEGRRGPEPSRRTIPGALCVMERGPTHSPESLTQVTESLSSPNQLLNTWENELNCDIWFSTVDAFKFTDTHF